MEIQPIRNLPSQRFSLIINNVTSLPYTANILLTSTFNVNKIIVRVGYSITANAIATYYLTSKIPGLSDQIISTMNHSGSRLGAGDVMYSNDMSDNFNVFNLRSPQMIVGNFPLTIDTTTANSLVTADLIVDIELIG